MQTELLGQPQDVRHTRLPQSARYSEITPKSISSINDYSLAIAMHMAIPFARAAEQRGERAPALRVKHVVPLQPRLVLSLAGPEPDDELKEWIESGLVAGVVLFADNFVSISQLTAVTGRLKEWGSKSFHIMIDEEGGRVRRLPPNLSPMPSISSYGADGKVAQTAQDYASVCRTLSRMGINTLLAPVLDVRTAENTWLADRMFSDNSQDVVEFASYVVHAVQHTGVAACAKHFPGLGGVHDDLHHRQFLVGDSVQQIEERDLPPFRSAIAAGVGMIMVSHAIYYALDPVRPAVFSPLIVTELLRKRLGFSGLILTDDLVMGAITHVLPIEKAVDDALQAGCDLILVCRNRPVQRRAVHYLSQRVVR